MFWDIGSWRQLTFACDSDWVSVHQKSRGVGPKVSVLLRFPPKKQSHSRSNKNRCLRKGFSLAEGSFGSMTCGHEPLRGMSRRDLMILNIAYSVGKNLCKNGVWRIATRIFNFLRSFGMIVTQKSARPPTARYTLIASYFSALLKIIL